MYRGYALIAPVVWGGVAPDARWADICVYNTNKDSLLLLLRTKATPTELGRQAHTQPVRRKLRLRAANRREQDPKTTNTCEDSIKKLQRQGTPVT